MVSPKVDGRAARVAGLVEVPAIREEFREAYARSVRPHATCYVYEVWDVMNRLVYVGIADSFERRWQQHRAASWWLGEIDVYYIRVEGYRSRWEARQIEAAVINEQHPVYNTSRELPAYAAYQGLWDDPQRPVDEWDCIPVSKRKFLGEGVF